MFTLLQYNKLAYVSNHTIFPGLKNLSAKHSNTRNIHQLQNWRL